MYGFIYDELVFLEGEEVSYIAVHNVRVTLEFESGGHLDFGGVFRNNKGEFDFEDEDFSSAIQFLPLIGTTITRIKTYDSGNKGENYEYEHDVMDIHFSNGEIFTFFDYSQYEFMYAFNSKTKEDFII